MAVKNSDLFSFIDDMEAHFMLPDEEPWRALIRLADLMGSIGDGTADPRSLGWELLRHQEQSGLDAHKGTVDIMGAARVFGGKGLKTDSSAYIKGPVYIGRNVTIRANVVLTGPCFIGDEVKLGHNCRVKDSIIRNGAELVYSTHLADCVVGARVRIDKSVQIADWPVPPEITARFPRLESCGAAIGDGAKLGVGSVLGPGVILMPDSHLLLGACIRDSDTYSGCIG